MDSIFHAFTKLRIPDRWYYFNSPTLTEAHTGPPPSRNWFRQGNKPHRILVQVCMTALDFDAAQVSLPRLLCPAKVAEKDCDRREQRYSRIGPVLCVLPSPPSMLSLCKPFSLHFLRRIAWFNSQWPSNQAIILRFLNLLQLHLTYMSFLSMYLRLYTAHCIIPAILHFGRLLTNRPMWIHFGN